MGRSTMSSKNGISIANSNMHYSYYSLDDFIKAQTKLGIRNIEFYGSTPHFWIDHKEFDDCLAIKGKMEAAKLRLVAFAPNLYYYSLCAAHPEQVRNSLHYFENCIRVTAQMGLSYFILTPAGGCNDLEYQETWDLCRQSLIHLCRAAEEYNLNLALGTAARKTSPVVTTLEELAEMKKQVDADNLKITLDLVTMSQADETVAQWFRAFSKEIVHVHFSDGNNESYQICGEGCYPLMQYLQQLNQCGYKGTLGLYIPNLQYWYNPYMADKDNLRSINAYFSKSQITL